ncbi:MAG: hypothetical protein K1X85_14375 [Ignavibacteria bacterium]|nr:hypothetical protein [Ignavibacteria bacterium]
MKRCFCMIIILTITAFVPDDAFSIPAFARKYNMSCKVCHSPFPRVKPYGDDFAANGFQLPDKEPPRFAKKTGDDLLLLMRELPLAIRFELFAEYENDRETDVDLRTPYLLKLMSGGNIFKDISYYFYFFLSERGEVAGIEDAFIHFNNVFSEKSDFDILAGQFQVSDPLFKRELRLEVEDYQIYRVRPGRSLANLTYDRGLIFGYGSPTKTDLVLEIVNGNGIGTTEILDVDKYKNFMFRASQEINPFLRIGGFGYYGKERPDSADNEFYIAGADLTAGNDKVELNAQYVYRADSNPEMLAAAPSERVKTQGGFAELIITPEGDNSRFLGYLLYNIIDSDLDDLDYQSYTAGVNYLLARNLRIVGEYTYEQERKKSRVSVGFVTAF